MEIGRFNSLEILKKVDFGIYLDGGDGIEILMPRRYVPENVVVGEMLDAFVYRDSEDRLIATTIKPLIMVGECACLKVQAVNHIGAFLDWGLPKDLLVPFNQMATPLNEGDTCVVTAYVDKRTGRIAASTRLSLFLNENGTGFHVGQQVALQIVSRSDLGVKAVVNGSHLGLLFHAEVKQDLQIGEKVTGFIKRVRPEDQRIDLALNAGRALSRQDLHGEIVRYLQDHDGTMSITDKSPPDLIMREFGVSKAGFKRALGALYKDKIVLLSPEKVTLVKGAAEKLKKKSATGNKAPKKSHKPQAKPGVKKPVKGAGAKPAVTAKNKTVGKADHRAAAGSPAAGTPAAKPVSDNKAVPRSSAKSVKKPEKEPEEFIDPDSPWAAAMQKSKAKKDR